jgi:CheY-like chemotaxis protein
MNILVHDDPPAVGRLVRAALSGRRHRASIAASADEARRKLETGLFDALVIGAGGASREIAEFLESEWPDLPIVLAGVEHEVPVGGPIVAVLTRPLRLESLRAAVRALEGRVPAFASDVQAELIAGDRRVLARLIGRGPSSLLFEPATEAAFDAGPLTVRCGGADAEADLVFADDAPRGGARYVAVRVGDASALERILTKPLGGVAC